MFNAHELSAIISDVFRIHSEFAKKPENAFRKFDGKTPYGVHPNLSAMLFLHEESLREDFRVLGAKALFGHDFLEDTTATLPEWCMEPEVRRLIQELTFLDGEDPLRDIWNRSQTAIMLKFYDVVANLMCVSRMSPERIEERKKAAREHLAWVESRWSQLEIIKIARGLLA